LRKSLPRVLSYAGSGAFCSELAAMIGAMTLPCPSALASADSGPTAPAPDLRVRLLIPQPPQHQGGGKRLQPRRDSPPRTPRLPALQTGLV